VTAAHVIESTAGTLAAMLLYQGARRVAAGLVWRYFKRRMNFVGTGVSGGKPAGPKGR
jgi:hypothetical protein